MTPDARRAAFERLKKRLQADERAAVAQGGPVVSLGAAALDAAIPAGGLAPGLHEVRARAYFDAPAAALVVTGFLARLAAARAGPVLWCRPRGGGAQDFGAP
ncbi:MAG: hypothetical protein MI723_05535, partial [Caulobacterales bacterium]|nr:hypothetical protein [Caulobacterales bacterium]